MISVSNKFHRIMNKVNDQLRNEVYGLILTEVSRKVSATLWLQSNGFCNQVMGSIKRNS